MSRLLTIVLICCYINCLADEHKKTIIIDTVTGQIRHFKVELNKSFDGELLYSNYLSEKNDKDTLLMNVIAIAENVYVGDKLCISIDDNDSSLSIENLNKYPGDTLRISRINVYKNCVPDTIIIDKYFYRIYINDTGGQDQRFVRKKKYLRFESKKRHCLLPTKSEILVNGIRYVVNFTIVKNVGSITVGHGTYNTFFLEGKIEKDVKWVNHTTIFGYNKMLLNII